MENITTNNKTRILNLLYITGVVNKLMSFIKNSIISTQCKSKLRDFIVSIVNHTEYKKY